MRFCVYQLRASDEAHPFYIGKTFKDSKRLVEHRYSSRNHGRMVCTKIKSVERRVATVLYEVLEWFELEAEAEAHHAEIKLIKHYGRRDNQTGILCNHTDGGEGTIGKIHTAETRVKMSRAKLGNKINLGRKRPDFAAKSKKPVTVFLANGSIVGTFDSSKYAAVALGVSKTQISDCIVGRCRTTKSETGVVYQFRLGEVTTSIDSVAYRQHTGLGQVSQYTKQGAFVETYRNSKDAQQKTGIAAESIRGCLHGTAKTAGGFIWKLAEQEG